MRARRAGLTGIGGAVTLVLLAVPTGQAVGRATDPGSTAEPQRITVTSQPPSPARPGGEYRPTATGGASGNPVRFAVAAEPGDVCSVDGSGLVRFDHPGACTVLADQAGDDAHAPAVQEVQPITVEPWPQAVAFTSTAPAAVRVGQTYVPRAAPVAGGPGEPGGDVGRPISHGAGPDTVCTLADGRVRFTGVGTCTVTADRAGGRDHAAAPQVRQTVPVGVAGTSLDLLARPGQVVVTLTAQPGASAPTGSVAVTVRGAPLGTATLTPVADRPDVARAVVADPVGASGRIVADYRGTATAYGGSGARYTRAAPTISVSTAHSRAPRSDAGWWRAPVRIGFDCDHPDQLRLTCQEPVVTSGEGRTQVVRGVVVAADGGRATVTRTLAVDLTPPTLRPRTTGSAPYGRRARPVRCGGADALSGLASCRVTYVAPARRRDGSHHRAWRAVAVDRAGHTTTHRGSFRVRAS